jgi:hypothetical protein
MQVTDNIGAVARTVLESLRTLFVWLGDLAIFYLIPLPKSLGEIGEKWDNSSYLQAVGFVILVAGTLVYARGDQEEEKNQVRSSFFSESCLPILRPCYITPPYKRWGVGRGVDMSLLGFPALWDKTLSSSSSSSSSQNLQAVADEGCHLEGPSPNQGTAYRGVYCIPEVLGHGSTLLGCFSFSCQSFLPC